MKTKIKLTAAALCLAMAGGASAATVPMGVQTNVAAGTVSGWGFSECYSSTYASNQGTSIRDEIDACSTDPNDYIMLAARQTGSSTFSVLAATVVGFLRNLDTGFQDRNSSVASNGAEWYNADRWSVGFAGLGDPVNKSQCDTGRSNPQQRLCWHLVDSLAGGYRAGSVLGLNNSTSWEKVMLVASPSMAPAVPVPAAGLLLISALAGAAALRRRRKAA